ncbi:hypothetical protein ABBQ32_005782 [Trebouxia sp. C0010 RCD-2024]
MQAASTKLLRSDRVMLVSAGATRHRPFLEGLHAVIQPVHKPPDTAASTKRWDSVCCLGIYHGASHLHRARLHGACLVSVLKLTLLQQVSELSWPLLRTVARVFETVP